MKFCEKKKGQFKGSLKEGRSKKERETIRDLKKTRVCGVVGP